MEIEMKMKNRQLLNKLVLEVNELLSLYIDVHNRRLKEVGTFFSLFRRVNFKGIYLTTQFLLKQFEEKKEEFENLQETHYQDFALRERELFNCLLEYFNALHKTCINLSALAHAQYLRSENKRKLSFAENKQLENVYKSSIDKYLASGERLNKLYKTTRGRKDENG